MYGPGGWYEEEFVKRLRQPGRFAVIGRATTGGTWCAWRTSRPPASTPPSTAATGVYHVADDEPIRYYDFIALTAKALGVGPPRRVPAWLARLAAGQHAVTAVVRSARSNARLKEELGWAPRFPTAPVGVPDAVAGLAG